MNEKISVGTGIKAGKSSWCFGGDTPGHFDDHIRQSVPGYEQGHDIVLALSDFFCLPDSVCYDLGTSTGTLIKKLADRHRSTKPNISWIGIDSIEEMAKQAEKNTQSTDVEIICADVRDVDLLASDFIVSYYFIQFIPPRHRQQIIDKIYQSLNWGGAFVWFEKVRGPDARFQDMLSNLYANFKLEQGFSAEEILNKSESLKTVLEPFSHQANMEFLARSGFRDVMPIFRNICFEGLVCIK